MAVNDTSDWMRGRVVWFAIGLNLGVIIGSVGHHEDGLNDWNHKMKIHRVHIGYRVISEYVGWKQSEREWIEIEIGRSKLMLCARGIHRHSTIPFHSTFTLLSALCFCLQYISSSNSSPPSSSDGI